MNCLPLLLCLMSLLDSGLTSLPAPVNLFMKSVNFRYVLHWDPGPGTPPRTKYEVRRVISVEQEEKNGTEQTVNRKFKLLSKTNTTSVKLVLQVPDETYYLTVRASYKGTKSPDSAKIEFNPSTDTKIGAPTLSLAGCGRCIQVNISLPEPDRNSRVIDIHSFYLTSYKIWWRKRDGEEEKPLTTGEKSYNLSALHKGEEYCVRVLPEFTVNGNVNESALVCALTSTVGPNRGPVVLGSVASVVILVIAGVMAAMFLLYYTGFICKLKATLPRVLIAALSGGYTLTPERTTPDQIIIIPEKQRRQNNATTPRRASRHANSEDEEDEEEEEEGLNVYMNRPTDLSSDQSSSRDSGNASGSRTLEVEVPELEVEHEGLDADEAEAEGAAEVSFPPEEAGVRESATGEEEQQEVEEEEEEVCHSSGNIDLFSITLASLAVREEEEEEEKEHKRDSLTNLLRLCQQPGAPTDSQTERDHQTAVAVTLPAQEDFTGSGYEVKRTFSDCFKTSDGETQEDEDEDEEEDEEEEDFSGYMRHT